MIRGFITNLGAYNNGRLQGKWIEFPIEETELNKVLEEIGINEFNEEYFFTDWETDWEIEPYEEWGEYPNIDEVNDITNELYDIENDNELEWLYAYMECTEASLREAIDDCQDRSIFYGSMDSCSIVEEYFSDTGINNYTIGQIVRYIDSEDFIESELNLYKTEYGYIECF